MTVELIRQAQAGDHAAFEMLATAAYERLYGIAYRILRNREAAEDATQDALVRCWRDLRGLREPDRFEAWLHRLVVNACRDLTRRGRRRPQETYASADTAAPRITARRLCSPPRHAALHTPSTRNVHLSTLTPQLSHA